MNFLLDESVTGDAYSALVLTGIVTRRSIDIIGSQRTDREVVELGDTMKSVVVDANPRHFRRLISRRPENNNLIFRFASRLSLKCEWSLEARRLHEVLHLVEYEWRRRQTLPDKRLIMEVANESVTLF